MSERALEIRFYMGPAKKLLVNAGIFEAGHRTAIKTHDPGVDDEIGAL